MDELFTRKLSSRIAERLSDTNDYEETRPKKNESLRNLMNRNVKRSTFDKKFINSEVLRKNNIKTSLKRNENKNN